MNAAQGRSRDNLAALTDAKTRICIYGSGAVVKKLRAFEDVGPKLDNLHAARIIGELVVAMRRDSGATEDGVLQEDLIRVLLVHQTSNSISFVSQAAQRFSAC